MIPNGALGVEYEFIADLQCNLSVFKFTDANFRALKVDENAHRAAEIFGYGFNVCNALRVFLGDAVGEIHAHHIDTGVDHACQCGGIAGCGAEGCDDFGFA